MLLVLAPRHLVHPLCPSSTRKCQLKGFEFHQTSTWLGKHPQNYLPAKDLILLPRQQSVNKLLGAEGSGNRQRVRNGFPVTARAHAAILSHSCYSLHLCDDICDKKMLIVLRSTVMNTLESGLSFSLVHLHLSHIILRKSAIYISLSASFTCQKRIWGGNFF